ncbi:MAG: nucleotidyltransferase domain-containing protein [Nitrospirota bacterium]
MTIHEISTRIKPIIQSHPEIKLAYFFGSQATNKAGAMSDFDFAFYMDERDTKKLFDLRFTLMDEIGRALKTDKVDIVILNLTESPELKYNIIKEGELIYNVEPFKVLIEPKILNEYFDFRNLLISHNLTKA